MEAIKESTPTADALRVVGTLLSRLMIQKWWRIPRDYDEALISSNLCTGLFLTFDELYTILRSVGLLYLHTGGEPQQSSSNYNLSPSSSIEVNEVILCRLPRLFPSLNLQVQKGFPISSRQVVCYYILRGTPTTTTVEQPPTTSTSALLGKWSVLPKTDYKTTASPKNLAVSNTAVYVMEVSKCEAPILDYDEASVKKASQERPSTSSSNRVVPDIVTSKRIRKDRIRGYEGGTMNRASPSRLGTFNKAVLGIRSTRLKRNASTQYHEAAAVKRASPNRPATATSSNQTVPLMAKSQRKAPFLVQYDEATVKRENTKQQQKRFGQRTAGGGTDKKKADKDCCCTEDVRLLCPLEASTNLMSEIWSIPSAPLVVSSAICSKESVEEDESVVIVAVGGESAAQRTTPRTTTNDRQGQQQKVNIDEDSIDYIAEEFTCLDPS